MSILLIICLAILIFCTIRGYKKGLFGIVFGIISWIFIAVCLIYGTPKMNENLRANSRVYNKVYSSVEKYVSAKVDAADVPDISLDSVNALGAGAAGVISQDQINEKVQESLSLLPKNIAAELQDMSDHAATNGEEDAADTQDEISDQVKTVKDVVVQRITKTVTNYVISVMAFVLTLIVAWIIILIVSIIIKIIELNRGVKIASHGLGLVFGIAEGLLLVFIILYIISAVSMITNGQKLENDINNSVIMSFLYTHNPITNFFTKN